MDVSVIIVAYNSVNHIATCIQSVSAQSGATFETIVVDNASSDNTLALLAGFNARVIASRENLGFGRGNNLGFASSSGRYIYLLNPDAQLLERDALAKLCRNMDANRQWGMAGTRVLDAADHREIFPATEYPAQRHVRRDFSKLPGKIAWFLGASLVIRRELYEKLGGFDPGFFLYSEETDFCLRMRKLGFEIGHISEVTVEHVGHASEDAHDPYEVSARKLKGLIYFRQKHYPPADCVRLASRDMWRAGFRAVWNGLLARFQPVHSSAWRKYRNYHAIWKVSRDYLFQADHANDSTTVRSRNKADAPDAPSTH